MTPLAGERRRRDQLNTDNKFHSTPATGVVEKDRLCVSYVRMMFGVWERDTSVCSRPSSDYKR